MERALVLLGLLVMLIGVVLVGYVGIWLCLVGGIVDIITEVRAVDMDVMVISFGVLKLLLFKFVVWVSEIIFLSGISITKTVIQ